MSTEEYIKVPRLTIEVTEDVARRMSNAIPWGLRGKVMAILIEDLLELIDQEGDIIITALINRVIGTKHIVKDLPKKGGVVSGTK